MQSEIIPIKNVIPESKIIVFSPHFDDFLFMLGGYVTELKSSHLLESKSFHLNILFSRSNYLARTGDQNSDNSLDRLKLATGKRLMEDQKCNEALLGRFNYRYELSDENECMTRGKGFAKDAMEFPHGMYEDFNQEDEDIFERMKNRIRYWSSFTDTALIFPMAFREHIDHFIVREAALAVAKEKGDQAGAAFYFQEDKPYSGLATTVEMDRANKFISDNQLEVRTYEYNPQTLIEYAFGFYISQVEDIYKTGILDRSAFLQQSMNAERPCDRIYLLNKRIARK